MQGISPRQFHPVLESKGLSDGGTGTPIGHLGHSLWGLLGLDWSVWTQTRGISRTWRSPASITFPSCPPNQRMAESEIMGLSLKGKVFWRRGREIRGAGEAMAETELDRIRVFR